MDETLVLRRRPRWNRVLPAILRALQDKLMFWRRVPSLQWDWITLLLLAGLLWTTYLLLTGRTSVIFWFALGLIAKEVHDNALPIFARVRIRGDKITLGTLFTERHSLEDVQHYQTSQENLPDYSVQFLLDKQYWMDSISFVVDKEDCEQLIAFLQSRGIGAVAACVEQLSPGEVEA